MKKLLVSVSYITFPLKNLPVFLVKRTVALLLARPEVFYWGHFSLVSEVFKQ